MIYEVSSVMVAGFLKAARELGVLDAALPLVTPPYRAIIDAPHRKSWVPGELIMELNTAIAKTSAPERVADVNYVMSKDSISRIVMPLLKVTMALFGRNPAAIFSKLYDVSTTSIRGVGIDWQLVGTSGGAYVIRYPIAVPAVTHHAWEGVFRFGFELAGREGRVAKSEFLDGDKTLRIELSWS
jgi:hypothetical protein